MDSELRRDERARKVQELFSDRKFPLDIMLKKMTICLVFIYLIFTGSITALAQEDAEDSKYHPLISRYEGSYIMGYEQVDYDRLEPYRQA